MDSMVFEKLNVTREGAVLFAAINAPPMNLEGPELIRDLISLTVRLDQSSVARRRTQRMEAAMKRGFQTRDAEMNLGHLVADL